VLIYNIIVHITIIFDLGPWIWNPRCQQLFAWCAQRLWRAQPLNRICGCQQT